MTPVKTFFTVVLPFPFIAMIKVPFSLIATIGAVLINIGTEVWRYTRERARRIVQVRVVCDICGNLFYADAADMPAQCPRCGSKNTYQAN